MQREGSWPAPTEAGEPQAAGIAAGIDGIGGARDDLRDGSARDEHREERHEGHREVVGHEYVVVAREQVGVRRRHRVLWHLDVAVHLAAENLYTCDGPEASAREDEQQHTGGTDDHRGDAVEDEGEARDVAHQLDEP